MKNRLSSALVFVAAAAAMAPAGADPIDLRAARGQLFSTRSAEVAHFSGTGLSDKDRDTIATVGAQQVYYGAFAISPDEGLLSEATAATANHHSADAAMRAALAECNRKRQSGASPCVPAAHIRPKGWQARDLQLSATATDAVGDGYRKARAPKVFVISPATGAWSIGGGAGGENTALEDCADKAGAGDCTVVISD